MATIKDLIANGTGWAGSQMAPTMPQQKGGLSLKDILGIVGDSFLGFAGQNPIYGPAKQRQQERQDQFQQQWNLAEKQGQMATDRWKAEQEWKLNHPDPTATQQDFAWYKGLSPEDRQTFDQFKPVLASTWQGPVPVPRSSLGGGDLPAIGTTMPDPRKNMSAQVPSGNPLSQPQNPVLDQFIGMYGQAEGQRRYNELVRLGGQ